jgi:Uri superfamily endonuclease
MDCPSCRGTYILFLHVDRGFATQVGTLGFLDFKPGIYAYVGSAFGQGGCRARWVHHLSPVRTHHWHIDYLSQKADLVEIWYTCDPGRREHEWARIFTRLPGVSSPFSGFGATDCRCRTHLFHMLTYPSKDDFYERLLKWDPGHKPIQRLLPETKIRSEAKRE